LSLIKKFIDGTSTQFIHQKDPALDQGRSVAKKGAECSTVESNECKGGFANA